MAKRQPPLLSDRRRKKIYKWSDQLDLLTCEESDGQAESVPAADEASSIFVMSWNRDLHRSPPQNS